MGALVLCGGAPRTMSGGEPSSIKRIVLCAAGNLCAHMRPHTRTVHSKPLVRVLRGHFVV